VKYVTEAKEADRDFLIEHLAKAESHVAQGIVQVERQEFAMAGLWRGHY
jgi:hypothetical protein